MANEATVRRGVIIRRDDATGYMNYSAPGPTGFNVSVTGANGPTPGAINVATAGTDVLLSQLTTPGLCTIFNMDDTNYIEFGIWDGSTFWPLGEVGPKEAYDIKLSRNLDLGVGTAYGSLRLRANTAACKCFVGAMEK